MLDEPEPAAEPAIPVPVRVYHLRELALEDLVTGDVRRCDACAQEQLYGCAVTVKIRYFMAELCEGCWADFRAQVDAIPRRRGEEKKVVD